MDHIYQKLLTVVKKYKMPTTAAELLSQKPPLIICSVTASGKNTVADYIIKTRQSYQETVSHTTRPPREGEINGKHYWFIDEAKMLELVRAQVFIEVKTIHGQTIYGTSIESYKTVIGQDHKPLLVIDVQGVEEILRGLPKLKPYFLLPPSYEEWMNRLHSRGVITEEDKTNRIISAKREIATVLQNPAYILVVNDDVERTAHEILSAKVDKKTQTKNRQIAQQLLLRLGANS